MRRAALVALALAACGDGSLPPVPPVTAVSGTRLTTMWIGYDDGARQLHREQVYDLVEHTPCQPRTWADGVTRCTPVADEAFFADATCTRAVGRSSSSTPPTHFLGRDRIDGTLKLTRLYRAGPVVPAITSIWERRDGTCRGPFTVPEGPVHHALSAEVAPRSLAVMSRTTDGAGPLGLVTYRSPDGLVWPVIVDDRDLGWCHPEVGGDGRVRCLPLATARTNTFSDPTCERPLVVDDFGHLGPGSVIEVLDSEGCPSYWRVRGPTGGQVFVRNEFGCFAIGVDPEAVVLDASEPIEPVELERTVEDEPFHRLQAIVLEGGGLRFHDDRMHDTATGEDCRPTSVDGDARCLPETVATANLSLFGTSSCLVTMPVAELPQQTCRRARFARPPDAPPGVLHLIGDPRPDDLFMLAGQCTTYQPPFGVVPYALGPALDPELFVGGILFGER